jgi:hypothetical protein
MKIAKNKWVHLAVVHGKNMNKVYIDGKLKKTLKDLHTIELWIPPEPKAGKPKGCNKGDLNVRHDASVAR